MRTMMMVVLCAALASPAFAGDLQASINRATRQAAVQQRRAPSHHKNAYLWPVVALVAGGGALAVLAGTAFRETTAACVGGFLGVVCGGTQQTNKAVLWGGIAAAGLGATLLVIGAHHASSPSITIAPGMLAITKRITW